MKERRVGRPPGRAEYESFDVYITPEFKRTWEEVREEVAPQMGLSTAAFVRKAVTHYMNVVKRRMAKADIG